MPARVLRLPRDDPALRTGLARIRAEFDVPLDFPPEVHAAAARAAGTQRERRDLRDVELLTIDPKGSRDLDQAYAAETRGDGFRVHYAIADVEAFVEDGGVLDQEAHRRAVTIYLPDGRAPLYPGSIGDGAASLLPGQERPALCWTFDLDAAGTPTTWHLEPAIVRSRRAWTYAEAQEAVDAGRGPESLRLLRAIGELRQAAERARGGVSLRLPTQEVRRRKRAYTLAYDVPRPIEGWNAQLSLMTGMCAATTMAEAGVGILRTLPPPDDRTLARLRRTASALGIPWARNQGYADLVRRLDPSDPDHAALLDQAAESLRGAGYALLGGPAHPLPHGAIAAPYAHVTAPLRRLADRYANAVLLELLSERVPSSELRAALEPLPEIMGNGARRAAGVERAVVDLVEALLVRDRVGDVMRGVVVDLDDERATVLVRDPAIVASVEAAGAALGEEIAVRLLAADAATRRIELARVD